MNRPFTVGGVVVSCTKFARWRSFCYMFLRRGSSGFSPNHDGADPQLRHESVLNFWVCRVCMAFLESSIAGQHSQVAVLQGPPKKTKKRKGPNILNHAFLGLPMQNFMM